MTATHTPIAPLSLPHRVLRALEHRELTFVQLRETVAADGHPATQDITFCITATAQLLGDDLLVKDGLHYGVSLQGQAVLADLELLVSKAIQDKAKGSAPKAIAPPPIFDPHVGQLGLGCSFVGSLPRKSMSHTERQPAAMRPGSQAALLCPSRIGDRLHHRDGRVTDMQGQPITTRSKP